MPDEILTEQEKEILRILLKKVTKGYNVKWASDLGFALLNLGYTTEVLKR